MAQGSNFILGRYRPLGEAGAGGFGTVQIAYDQRIQRKVAIKIIALTELDAYRASLPGAEAVDDMSGLRMPEEYGAYEYAAYDDGAYDDAAYDGFDDEFDDKTADEQHMLAHLPGLDEARTAAMLDNPHIVTVYDFEVRDRTAYLIMEYVEGLTLTKLMRVAGDRFSLDMITAVFDSVADALCAAHRAGVLHLDIKPDNILINAKGQVKVTDFGLATLADAAGMGTTGGGTIGYMPLEQMRRQHVDARTDEWSLASVTYEMLTGENAFLANSLAEAPAAIEEAALLLPSSCWNDLDPEIDDVLFYALEPDKENRYDTVADFAEEMDKFLGNPVDGQLQMADIVADEVLRDMRAEEEESGLDAGYEGADAIEFTRGESDSYDRAPSYRGNIVRADDYDDSEVEEDSHGRFDPIGRISDAFARHSLSLLGRVFAAAACAFFAFIVAGNIPQLAAAVETSVAIPVLAAAIAAAAGFIVPSIGAAAVMVFFAAALILSDSVIVGVLLLLASVGWWLGVGRHGLFETNAALVLPAAGAFGGGAFSPLVTAASGMPFGRTLGSAAYTCFLALVIGALGSGSLISWRMLENRFFMHTPVGANLLDMLTQPAVWCMVVAWLVACILGALLARRQTKFWRVIGVVAATIALLLGLCMATFFTSNLLEFIPPIRQIFAVLVPAIAMIVGITIPKRSDTL